MEGNSLAVQWLRLHTSTTQGGSIPDWGTKIYHDKKKKKENMEYTYFGVLRSHFQNEVDLYEVTWRKNCKLLLKVKSMMTHSLCEA